MAAKRVEMRAEVVIDIDPGLCSNVISRCVDNEPDTNGRGEVKGWRDFYYDLQTEDEVYAHLAFNCLVNGIEDVRRLDGWADVPEDAVRMWVDRQTVESW